MVPNANHRIRTLAVAALAALLASGCGGSNEDDIESAVRALAQAVEDEDYAAACDRLTRNARKQLKALSGSSGCEKALQRAGRRLASAIPDPDRVKVENIEIVGDRASAEVNGEEASFAVEDGDWKVSPE